MPKIIFDSSALIALFAKENGYQIIKSHMKDAVISSVNIAEVYKFCIEMQRLHQDEAAKLVELSGIKIVEFCHEQALISAEVIHKTKVFGLSLGDRACLALAIFKGRPVLTCDKIWTNLELDVEFILPR